METVSSITIPVNDIGQRYSALRIIQPKADKAMERSMSRYGQLTPVVIGARPDDRYEMVDGFKRLRAGRKLGYSALEATVMSGCERVMKAAIIHLNVRARTIADLETALVIQSLHRKNGLSQVEIAALLDRHKSFVCRRLQLVEKLSADVIEHLKLGLINITIARQLVRLPAGNQAKALCTILKYRFTGSETARLVGLLLQNPRWNNEKILSFPEQILNERQQSRPGRHWCRNFYNRLVKMEVYLSAVNPGQLNTCAADCVLPIIERLQSALSDVREHLMRW
jgi:ParB/RepB/Spo0J family partition protein